MKKKEDKEIPWGKSGTFVILPDSRLFYMWSFIFVPTILISYLTFSYQASFKFTSDFHDYETFYDFICVVDLLSVFCIALRRDEISQKD